MSGKEIAHAVIGAGYGDEGKGLATDALADHLRRAGKPVTVVRSNGGAQAGHGVERPDGTRHVFHHIGAGTLAGARTHLSRFFVAHPMVFFPEAERLSRLAGRLDITIDPRALITTPFDMALNQALETARGGTRHGSCGLGFGETIERSENGFPLTAADLGDARNLADHLAEIAEVWLPRRIEALRIERDSPVLQMVIKTLAIRERFIEDALTFHAAVPLRPDADIGRNEQILFEGAQGLELDMDLGAFPHVTRSRCGITNMIAVAEEAGIEEICPLYMTRAYKTRHGAGPLPHEAEMSAHVDITDLTNVPNAWQGVIRTAPLDTDRLKSLIWRDIARVSGSTVKISPALGISCLDQIRHTAPVKRGATLTSWASADLETHLPEICNLPLGLSSFGPCREQVKVQARVAPAVSAPASAPSP